MCDLTVNGEETLTLTRHLLVFQIWLSNVTLQFNFVVSHLNRQRL